MLDEIKEAVAGVELELALAGGIASAMQEMDYYFSFCLAPSPGHDNPDFRIRYSRRYYFSSPHSLGYSFQTTVRLEYTNLAIARRLHAINELLINLLGIY